MGVTDTHLRQKVEEVSETCASYDKEWCLPQSITMTPAMCWI